MKNWRLANQQMERGFYRNALEMYAKCGRNPRIYFNIAVAYMKMSNYKKAMKVFTYIMHLNWTIVHAMVGNCLAEMGMYKEALIWYKRCLKRFGEYKEIDYTTLRLPYRLSSFYIYMNMFVCHEVLGFEGEARSDLLLAKKLHPGRLVNLPKYVVEIDPLFEPPTGVEVTDYGGTSVKVESITPKKLQKSILLENAETINSDIPLATSSPVYCK
eukprot:NODE_716_length_4828_cov_0.189258.p2 type:complete len:214 gc:universal NODE_716_length_4828_cov_0.189258:703-1344(+)